MELRQMRYFTRVAELGSFSRAAAFLKIAQPALSRQIRNLEEEFKEALFIRNGRGVEPTEAGKRLLEHVRGVLRQVDRAYEDMEQNRTGKLGRIAFGLPATLSTIIATPLVRRLRRDIPGASFTLLHGRSSTLLEWVLGGTLDMAIVFDAPETSLLEVYPILNDNMVVVGPRSLLKTEDPIPLHELAAYPIIMQSRPNKFRVMVDTALAEKGLAMNVVLESDSHLTGFEMAREGLGCTVHSMRFQRTMPLTGDLVVRKIVEPEIRMQSQVILPARRPASKLQDQALGIFKRTCRELMSETG